MAASSTPVYTVLGTTRMLNGKVRNRVKVALGSNYATATGVPITAAGCGLLQFENQKGGTSFLDPVVTGVNQGGILAEVVSLALWLGYPTGGGGTEPTTPVAPKVSTGADTASAVDATTPTITPGLGKAFPDQAVTTSLVVFLDAYGYPLAS